MRAAAWLALFMVGPRLACAAPAPTDPNTPSDPVPQGLAVLLGRPTHRGELLAAAQIVDKAFPTPCTTGNYATTGEVGMLAPLRQDPSGKPIGGAWKEAITETGCGAPRLLNVLTIVQPDGKLASYPLLPGTTITDPELQQDSVQYAAAAMGAMPPGCEQGGVIDTEFAGVDGQPPGVKPPAGGTPKPWIERWTLQACTKRVVVGMKFTPDATGTAIQAIPSPP